MERGMNCLWTSFLQQWIMFAFWNLEEAKKKKKILEIILKIVQPTNLFFFSHSS